MKTSIAFVLSALLILPTIPLRAATAPAPASASHKIDSTQFIFYSVLEGLYEDGISNEDVAQILMKKGGSGNYYHFVYACPICTPTIWALEAYQSRPNIFYSTKEDRSTFGRGVLPEELHKQLYSDDPHERLAAINTLVMGWITRRMDSMRLTKEEHSELLGDLQMKRKQGSGRLHDPNEGPTAYDKNDTQCAVCNAAVEQVWKAPETKQPQNLMHQ